MSGGAGPLHLARGAGDSLRNPVATAGPRFAEVAGEGAAVREAFAVLAEDAGMTVLGPPLAQSHPVP